MAEKRMYQGLKDVLVSNIETGVCAVRELALSLVEVSSAALAKDPQLAAVLNHHDVVIVRYGTQVVALERARIEPPRPALPARTAARRAGFPTEIIVTDLD
jgi:hypothetical protein